MISSASRKNCDRPSISTYNGTDGNRLNYDDPFDFARETKHITNQIGLLEKCIFLLGLYSLCLTIVSYPLEFEEKYDDENLHKSLWLILLSCLTMQIFLVVRNKFIIKLAVFRKEVPENTGILQYFPLQFL